MGKMKLESMVLGPVQTNCYLVLNRESGELLIVDPGAGCGDGRPAGGDFADTRPF